MPTYQTKDAPNEYKGDTRKPFTLIPDGTILEAVITEIKEDIKPYFEKDQNNNFLLDANGDKIPVVKLVWTFQTNYDDQDRKVWGETGIEFFEHPDCKAYGWSQEAFATTLPKGFVINTDDLIGKSVRITVAVRSYTKQGETEKRHVNYVQDVMRPRSAMASAPAPRSAPSYEEPF